MHLGIGRAQLRPSSLVTLSGSGSPLPLLLPEFWSCLHQGLPLIRYVGAAWRNRDVILVVASAAPLVQTIISIPSILLFATDLY